MTLKAPFPWFGGKSRVAHLVWDRFGDCDNYVEPFAGSLAVLLSRPHPPQTETVNDLDCYLANFWRALRFAADELAAWCDWPVNEADLHARHLWLVNQNDFRERMKTDPEFYDVRIAGWWVWGLCQWIGSGWCSLDGGRQSPPPDENGNSRVWLKRPLIAGCNDGRGVHRKLPHVGDDGRGRASEAFQDGNSGMGVNRQLPHLGDAGRGGNPATAAPGRCGEGRESGADITDASVPDKRPHLSGRGSGVGIHGDAASAALHDYFAALGSRLRRIRVCCGDWTRVLGPSVTIKHGICGVLLDPPYSEESGRAADLYSSDDLAVAHDVRKWAIANGDNQLLRIALCGYEGEHDMPSSWECIAWKNRGGYGSQASGRGAANAHRERIWFSPHCLRPQENLFHEHADALEAQP